MLRQIIFFIPFLIGMLFAGGGGHHGVNGEELPLFSIIPFVGILLSIAIIPLVAPKYWHHNFGKIAAVWAILFIVPFAIKMGFSLALYEFLHVMLLEYVPFIILLLALFTIAGGICLKGSLVGTPKLNLSIIFIGTALASWMGTTGAAMLLIRPLIRANKWRNKKVHIIIFFIFLVANVGGSLTPLGDPPLFLGFLQGVSFFWTTKALLFPFIIVSILLLIIFYFIDSYFYNIEKDSKPESGNSKLSVEGKFNFILLFGVVLSVLLSGFWDSEIYFVIHGVHLELQNIARDFLLLSLTFISWKLTNMDIRNINGFTWFPIQEVAKLFSGIFITIIPAIAILKAGENGALSSVINAVTDQNGNPINLMYFWLTGILSSFLDNAPTYLVFFNTAGGNAEVLMTDLSNTLLAISMEQFF